MLTRSRTAAVKENAAAIADLAAQLATDKKLRKRLLKASADELRAKRRIWTRDLQAARRRIERKPRHRLRNTLLVLGGAGGAAAMATPQARHWVSDRFSAMS